MIKLALFAVLAAASAGVRAHEAMSLEETLDRFGTDLANAEVRPETLAPGLHVLYGAGGNVVVSIGDQGVLMVDSQFPEMIPQLKRAIGALGGGGVDFTINTHWHYDHADGNPMLGREDSWFVSHLNSRRMMQRPNRLDYGEVHYVQPAYPVEALPVVTFDDSLQMFFNGQRIDVLHFGAAHTTGDAVIWFRNDNVIHMGDTIFPRYPYVDVRNGGSLDGLIAFCSDVLARIDDDTRIVPGHGPLMERADLADWVQMLATMRDRVDAMIDQGMTLAQILAARPSANFDDRYGNPAGFVSAAYETLSRRAANGDI